MCALLFSMIVLTQNDVHTHTLSLTHTHTHSLKLLSKNSVLRPCSTGDGRVCDGGLSGRYGPLRSRVCDGAHRTDTSRDDWSELGGPDAQRRPELGGEEPHLRPYWLVLLFVGVYL